MKVGDKVRYHFPDGEEAKIVEIKVLAGNELRIGLIFDRPPTIVYTYTQEQFNMYFEVIEDDN